MGMTVESMSEKMTEHELMQWVAFNQFSPIGDERLDSLAAIISSSAVAPHVKKLPPIQSFMPRWRSVAKSIPQKPGLMKSVLRGITKALGGSINDGTNRRT
jgi:hypothetical protein